MATMHGRLHELIEALSEEQAATVLSFGEALMRGRTVVSACDLPTADAAESDPTLIGYGLARYCALRGWTRAELADWFGILPDSLAALYAERLPKAGGGFTFVGLVQGIASKYMLDDTTKLYEAYSAGLDA
jgi:hypothetical protein